MRQKQKIGNRVQKWSFLIVGFVVLFISTISAQPTQSSFLNRNTLEEDESEDIIAREKFIYERRAGGPDKIVPANGYSQAVLSSKLLKDRYSLLEPQVVMWSSVNPKGMFYQRTNNNYISGRTSAIAFHPTDPNTFYIGSAGGGVWKTVDGGSTFMVLTDQLPNLACGAITIDQLNPSVLYFATGELHYSLDSHYGDGIYKSYDGGVSWKQVATNSIGSYFSQIIVDPTNSNVVYVSGSNGVYKSNDAGLTWATTGSGSNANCLVIDPTNTQILYTSVGSYSANTIKKTINGGGSWSTIMTGMTAANVGRTTLVMAASNSSVLYASVAKPLVGSSAPLYAVFKTVNGGTNWTSQNSTTNYLGNQGWYANSITVKPTDETFIVAGGLDCYSSSNSGTTLTQRSFWSTTVASSFAHADIHSLRYNGTVLYCCCDGGVFISNDDGVTWTDLNLHLSTLQYQSADYDPTNTQKLYGGCQDNNLETSTNGGTDWIQRTTGDGGYTVVDPTTTNYVYGQYVGGSLKRSDDYGVSFTEIGPSGSSGGLFYNPYEMAPGDHNTVVYGRADVWKTTSVTTATTASGWTQIATVGTINAKVSAIGISSTSVDKIYIGTNTSKVFVTANNGGNWSSQTIGGYVSDLAVDPADDNICYAVCGGFSAGNHIYKTINGGSNWTNITGTLPNIPVNTVVLKSSATRTLFIGTDLGVYKSTDEGTTWVPFSSGLPTIPIFDLKFKEGNQLLLAATHGRGCYTYDLNTATGPGIFISPTNLYFGNINGTGTTKIVTVTNTGTTSLSISLAISNNPELTVTPTTATIAPSASTNFSLKFAASALGTRTGKVTFFHNSKGAQSEVNASGNGIAPLGAPVQLDVVFILDVTGSTGALLPQWKSQMPTIINNFNATFPNSRFGLASHLDYPFSPYGVAGEYAYRLEAPLNNNITNLTSALNALTNGFGLDTPESQYEAIYQSVYGTGRDLNGDADYLDVGEIQPASMNYQAGNPTVIMHFTYPPSFHDRDVEPNYPYAGSQPVAGRTAAINALLSSSSMYFGLVTTAADKALTNNGHPDPLWKNPSMVLTDPIQELATLTGGAVLSTDVDLSQLSEAINASVDIINGNTKLYRSFSPSGLLAKLKGKLLKPIKRGKGMPNIANLLDEVVKAGGFGAYTTESDSAGGLRIGISFMKSGCKISTGPCTTWKPQPDSVKKYAWVRMTKWDFRKKVGSGYAALQATLEDKTGMHTGHARGLDSLFAKGIPKKKLLGQKMKLVPKDYNNHLFAELVALKFNIAASQLEKTPLGFGELVYQDSNALNGLMVKEVSHLADSAMTFWRDREWDYDLLDTVISKINRAFEGPVEADDTVSFVKPASLVLKGEVSLYTVPFLKPSNVTPDRISASRFADSGEEDTGENETYEKIPHKFMLDKAYPNPFNPITMIRYELANDSKVNIKIYDVLGREIQTLVDEDMTEGAHSVSWNASNVASGIYFCKLVASDFEGNELYSNTQKLIFTK